MAFDEWWKEYIGDNWYISLTRKYYAEAAWNAALENKWQPIKTAPKDGTDILLYWPDITMSHYPIIGYWVDNQHEGFWVIKRTGMGSPSSNPTQWYPYFSAKWRSNRSSSSVFASLIEVPGRRSHSSQVGPSSPPTP